MLGAALTALTLAAGGTFDASSPPADAVALQNLSAAQIAALAQTGAVADPALGLAVFAPKLGAAAGGRLELAGGGALRVTAVRDARAFDIYDASLPEGGDDGDRLLALYRLSRFIRENSAGRPFLLLGRLGVDADDKNTAVFLDLIEGRDLCVDHGDEVCAPRGGRRDFAVVAYSPSAPGRARRGAGGVITRLTRAFFRLKPAAEPAGRAEALAAVAAAADARLAEARRREAGWSWLPFLGTRDALRGRDDERRAADLREQIRTEQILCARAGGR